MHGRGTGWWGHMTQGYNTNWIRGARLVLSIWWLPWLHGGRICILSSQRWRTQSSQLAMAGPIFVDRNTIYFYIVLASLTINMPICKKHWKSHHFSLSNILYVSTASVFLWILACKWGNILRVSRASIFVWKRVYKSANLKVCQQHYLWACVCKYGITVWHWLYSRCVVMISFLIYMCPQWWHFVGKSFSYRLYIVSVCG